MGKNNDFAVSAARRSSRKDDELIDTIFIRTPRAGLYALAAYALMWVQSVFDGSYFVAATALFGIAMINSAQRLVQVLVGILFVLALFSDPIIRMSAKLV